MKNRYSARVAVISFTAVFLALAWVPAVLGGQPDNQATKVSPEYVAYYFYTSRRCGPCKTIEQWSRAAIEQNLKDEIKAGQLEWQAINVEKPGNKHFIEDFKLYTKSLIIAEYNDGKPVRWKNLKNVWYLYRDQEKYFDYVASEIREFMVNN